MKVYTRQEFYRLLKFNGYEMKKGQGKGDHRIFSNGTYRISVPYNGGKLSAVTTKRIIQKYRLKEK